MAGPFDALDACSGQAFHFHLSLPSFAPVADVAKLGDGVKSALREILVLRFLRLFAAIQT
jgi:hypothetical protein